MKIKFYTLFIFLFLNFYFLYSQEENLPHLYTYIDSSSSEQKVTITKEDIENLKAQSLSEVLEKKGLQNLNYGPYGMQSSTQLRGFTGSTVKVIVDGVCLNSEQNGSFDITTINVDDIEKIEVIRGGFNETLEAEGSVGGTIIITTKNSANSFKINSSLYTKSYFYKEKPLDTLGASFGTYIPLSQTLFFKLQSSCVFAHNQFPYINDYGKMKIYENSRVFDGSENLSLTKYFGFGNSISLMEKFYGASKECAGGENSNTPGLQKDYNNLLSLKLYLPDIKYFGKVKADIVWQSNNQFYDENFLIDKSEKSTHFLNSMTSQITYDKAFLDNWNFYGGANFKITNLSSSNTGNHLLLSGKIKQSIKFFTKPSFSLPLQFSFSLPQALTFSGKNFSYVPKLALGLHLPKVEFIFSASRLSLFPDMNQLYWSASSMAKGNPDLEAEDGWGAELNINTKNIFIPFNLSFFTNYYFNKIQWQSLNSLWMPVNVASAFYAGIDFSFEKKFLKYFYISANYEYLYTCLLKEGNTYGNKIMYTPDHTLSLTFSFNKSHWDFCIDGQFIGKRYYSNANITYLEPYFILNATLSYKFKKGICLFIKGDNLFDTDYNSVPGYPMPGISLTTGIKYTK